MITSSLKHRIDFYKPDSQKNNHTFSIDFSVMGCVVWKSGNLQPVNDAITYNQIIEVFTRKIPNPFNLNYHVKINDVEYIILSVNNIDKDLKITLSKWK